MKNYEVGIVIAVLIILCYVWYTKSQNQTANPVNAKSPGYTQCNTA